MALSDDYLNVTEVTFGWEYFAESPAMIKTKGHYFIFGSHLTGWNPNDNVSLPKSSSPPCHRLIKDPLGPPPPDLQLRRVPFGSLVRLDRIRPRRLEHPQKSSQLHPAPRHRERHLHRRPLDRIQSRRKHIRLATPYHLRHGGDSRLARQLDARPRRGDLGRTLEHEPRGGRERRAWRWGAGCFVRGV